MSYQNGIYKGLIEWVMDVSIAYIYYDCKNIKTTYQLDLGFDCYVINDCEPDPIKAKENLFVTLEEIYQHIKSLYDLDNEKYIECKEKFDRLKV